MPNLESCPEAWVMLHPSLAYQGLIQNPDGGRALALRRPLLAALVLGCAISLITSGRITLRLAAPGALYFTFVPLLEMGSLAVVWRAHRPGIGLARCIDAFFMGQAPWSLWLVAFSAMWAFLPAIRVFGWTNPPLPLLGSALLTILWSGCISYWFFRLVLARTRTAAIRDLILQRAICWAGVLACFVASAGWQVVATWLGL